MGTSWSIKIIIRRLASIGEPAEKDIKKAYRKLARKHHPDVNDGDKASEERFRAINEAYEVLSDPEKRQKYDRFGAQWRQHEQQGARTDDFNWNQWQAEQGQGHQSYRTVTPEEYETLFGAAAGIRAFLKTSSAALGLEEPEPARRITVFPLSLDRDPAATRNIRFKSR